MMFLPGMMGPKQTLPLMVRTGQMSAVTLFVCLQANGAHSAQWRLFLDEEAGGGHSRERIALCFRSVIQDTTFPLASISCCKRSKRMEESSISTKEQEIVFNAATFSGLQAGGAHSAQVRLFLDEEAGGGHMRERIALCSTSVIQDTHFRLQV
jgi:hypothetical protein